MKKIFLFFLVIVSVKAFSQTSVRLGLEAGGNYTISEKGAAGFWDGGFVETAFKRPSDKFRLQLEALYASVNTSQVSVGSVHYYDLKIRQFRLPLIAKYFITDALSINAGPAFNFDFNGQGTQQFCVGLLAGASYYFKNGIFIEGLYNKFSESSLTSDNIPQNNIQVGIGFRFPTIITDFTP